MSFHDDVPGVFSGLKELRPSGKVAAPMTLNMAGLSAIPEDLAPKKRRKRVAANFEGREQSTHIEDRRNPHQSAFTGEDEYATDQIPLGQAVEEAYAEAARRRKKGVKFDDHDYDD